MQAPGHAGDVDLAVEQSPTLEAMVGDVLVGARGDRKTAEDGVAVVTVVVDRIAAVGAVDPGAFGKKMVLRDGRPFRMALGVRQMHALDFLQEHEVGLETSQLIAQVVDHQATVELRKTLVDVIGADAQGRHRRALVVGSSSGLWVVF